MFRACLLAVASAACLFHTTPALATPSDGSPGQDTLDGGAGASSLSGGTWADVAGGVAGRPYVKSLRVVNGATTQLVYTGGPGGDGPTAPGDVTAVISPTNVCKTGAPTQNCYATPNRIGIQLGYIAADTSMHRDFSSPSVTLNTPVSESTVFDLVIGLGTIGAPLRWTWANGALESWKVQGLGTDSGEVRVRLRPALTPEIDWAAHPEANGCSATPIRDCAITQETSASLGAALALSVDDTLPPALSGAVFATQHAIMGYLQPGGTPDAPTLDLQIASSHLRADGSPQLGTLQAFFPSAGLQTLYGLTPEAAAASLDATRVGDPGTSDAPTFAVRAEDEVQSAGLLATIGSITFSAPTYRITKRGAPALGIAGVPTPAPTPTPTPAPAAGNVRVVSASRKKGIVLSISGARQGRATASLNVKGKAVLRGSIAIPASGTATLRLKPSRKAARTLRSLRRATLRVELPGQPRRTLTVKLR